MLPGRRRLMTASSARVNSGSSSTMMPRAMSSCSSSASVRNFRRDISLLREAFNDAHKLFPDDKASVNFITEAMKGREESNKAIGDEAKKREDAAKRAGELKKALDAARSALAARDFDGADKQIAIAAKIPWARFGSIEVRPILVFS